MPAIGDKVLYKGIKCTVQAIKPNGEIECVSEDGLLRVISEPSEFQTELVPFTVAGDHTPSPLPSQAAQEAQDHAHPPAPHAAVVDTALGQEQPAAEAEQPALVPSPAEEAPALPTPTEAPAAETPVDPAPQE